ncbi:MAG: threonine/serine exporter family protein [Clostridia bacterium]|nr:threonine/serine exporter family protein [Clostridia bacterium]
MEHNLTQKEILHILSLMGEKILRCGGEANRAEDTVNRIGKAYGMEQVHVFAIASSIIITIEDEDKEILTQTRRIQRTSTDLDKLDKLNALSREICQNCLPYDEVMAKIAEIDHGKIYPPVVKMFAYATISGSFSVFFGGGWKEGIVGFLVGAMLYFVIRILNYLQAPPFFTNVGGAAATVIFIKLFTFLCASLDVSAITIGVLMNLVPGVLLTNCIRDFVATDYSAGTSKIMETLLVAAAIALGVGVSILWR